MMPDKRTRPTSSATARQAVATSNAMATRQRPTGDKHASLLAALRARLGLAAEANEETILAALDGAIAAKRRRGASEAEAYPPEWRR